VALFPARFADLFKRLLAELGEVTESRAGEMGATASSAVFALCARSVGIHLHGVLRNLDALAGLYDRAGFVFVENDSDDDTKAQLKAWVETRPNATLIELDGLDARGLKFTDRMAACRNAYIDFIKASPLAGYDHLVVMDADNINRLPIDPAAFARGRDWLEQEDAAAVFANSLPFYYDIFALRHPTWCPGSPNDHIRQRPPDMDEVVARRHFVDDRQILIPTTAEPIEVQSAFGGLGIYRMADALGGRYVGLGPEGLQTCEHVSFNLGAARSGRGLYVLPWMTVGTDRAGVRIPEHHRTMTLDQGGRSCELTAPPDHRIDAFRRANPLYDRRLPILARLTGAAAPGTMAIDVGANVGDTVALCRLEGSELRYIAVEASLGYLKYLAFNRRRLPDLIGDVEMAWNFVGRPGESTTLELHRGTGRRVQGQADGLNFESAPHATLEEISRSRGVQPGELSLVKLDTDGFDFEILSNELDFLKSAAPILWAEAETWSAGDEAAWRQLLIEATDTWPYLIAFDNLGFAMVAGRTAKKRQTAIDIMSYARRHRAMPKSTHGNRPIYYIDVALFPERFKGVFEDFCAELPELANG
jgi:FkbM family methyltransferase